MAPQHSFRVDLQENEHPPKNLTSVQHDSPNSVKNVTTNAPTVAADPIATDNQSSSFTLPSNSSSLCGSSTESSTPTANKLHTIMAELAAYTDAPSSCTTEQYAGMSGAERCTMKKKDYAKELSRTMAQQLIRDIEHGGST